MTNDDFQLVCRSCDKRWPVNTAASVVKCPECRMSYSVHVFEPPPAIWECCCRCHKYPVLDDGEHDCCDECGRCGYCVKRDGNMQNEHASACMQDFVFAEHSPQKIADEYNKMPGWHAYWNGAYLHLGAPLLITSTRWNDDLSTSD